MPLSISNGVIINRKVIPHLIDKFMVEPDRHTWWHNRINQIYQEGLV